jgi:hypothetical protein
MLLARGTRFSFLSLERLEEQVRQEISVVAFSDWATAGSCSRPDDHVEEPRATTSFLVALVARNALNDSVFFLPQDISRKHIYGATLAQITRKYVRLFIFLLFHVWAHTSFLLGRFYPWVVSPGLVRSNLAWSNGTTGGEEQRRYLAVPPPPRTTRSSGLWGIRHRLYALRRRDGRVPPRVAYVRQPW